MDRVTEVMALVARFVDEMVTAFVNSKIYWSGHPRVQASIVKLLSHLEELARTTGEDAISIAVSKDFLVFESRPLLGASIGAPRLIKCVQDWHSGGMQFAVGASADDLSTFLEVLAIRPKSGDTHETLNGHLDNRDCPRLRLLPPYVESGDQGDPANGLDDLLLPVRLYQRAFEILQDATVAVCSGGRIRFDEVQAHVEQMVHNLQNPDHPMLNLAREEQYDVFTFGHSVRVAVLTLNFARAMTDDSELLVRIGTAALLHDVGKAVIPFEIFHSNAPLTQEERHEVDRHPEYGAAILVDHAEADELSIVTAFGHHRTVDFAGYPETEHEHRQSMVTRMVKICDVYEALTAARPYKAPITPTRAYQIMMGMGDQIDRRLLRKFIDVNGVFPNGQLLEMSTGELARVRQQGPKLLLPTVEMLTDAKGNRLDEADRRVVDLASPEARNLGITRPLDKDPGEVGSPSGRPAHTAVGNVDLQGGLHDPTCC